MFYARLVQVNKVSLLRSHTPCNMLSDSRVVYSDITFNEPQNTYYIIRFCFFHGIYYTAKLRSDNRMNIITSEKKVQAFDLDSKTYSNSVLLTTIIIRFVTLYNDYKSYLDKCISY